jgi:hypothetical protein
MVIVLLVRTQTRLFGKVGFVTALEMLGFILQPNLQIYMDIYYSLKSEVGAIHELPTSDFRFVLSEYSFFAINYQLSTKLNSYQSDSLISTTFA